MGFARTRTLRDAVLILLGATSMHLASTFMGLLSDQPGSIIVNTQVSSQIMPDVNQSDPYVPPAQDRDSSRVKDKPPQESLQSLAVTPIDLSYDFPETTIVSHAPGWTVFRHLYMSNGTLFIVTSQPVSSFPDISLITSTGLAAENTPENIAARMPTPHDMSFITPAQAQERWGGDQDKWERNRVWSVEGNTFLVNEPSQFLDHYYHFCAEYLLGAWAFWSGAFNAVVNPSSAGMTTAPPVHRAIFAHAGAYGWRDRPGFNAYVFRAAFPSLTVEVEEDWEDRIRSTSDPHAPGRAWHFDTVLFSDRSAAFRGPVCGSQTQRTAAEALVHMQKVGTLTHLWWEPVRRAVLRFAGVPDRILDVGVKAEAAADARARVKPHAMDLDRTSPKGLQRGQDVVITYISRQAARRHLIDSHHDALVEALTDLCTEKGWELNVVQAERLTKEQQLALAARTTVMLGVHGNGLTHLIMMPVTPISTVIEIFYPGGFAHDYQWTTHALGMRHFAIWNDTSHTAPNEPRVDYPEGFQGTEIPVHPPTVVKVIEDRVAGLVPL